MYYKFEMIGFVIFKKSITSLLSLSLYNDYWTSTLSISSSIHRIFWSGALSGLMLELGLLKIIWGDIFSISSPCMGL